MKKKKSESISLPQPAIPTHDAIAALAHSYWVAEGRPDGAESRHWLRAEAVLLAASKTGLKARA